VADVSNTDAFSSVWPDDLQSTTYEDFLPRAAEKAAGAEGCALRVHAKLNTVLTEGG
jgi:hypothetical protein